VCVCVYVSSLVIAERLCRNSVLHEVQYLRSRLTFQKSYNWRAYISTQKATSRVFI